MFAVQAEPFLYLAGDDTSPGARKMIEDLAPGKFLMHSQPVLPRGSMSFRPERKVIREG